MSYATVAQLREYLDEIPADAEPEEGEEPETTWDDRLQNVLDRATAIVDEALGFSFAGYVATTATDGERDIRGGSGSYLDLPAHDIGSVESVAWVTGLGATWERETAVTDYKELRDGRLYRATGWGETWYRITAGWGYGDAPTSIVEVTLEVAVNLWQAKKAARFSDVVGVEGAGAVGYEKALTKQQEMVVKQVRRRCTGMGVIW